MLLIFLDIFTNFFKTVIGANQLLNLLRDQLHFTAGGKTVNDADLAVRKVMLVICLGNICRVAAAGKIAGDGDAKHIGGIAKGFQPILGRGTSCGGFAGVGLQIPDHGSSVEVCVIDVFFFIGNDFQRDGNHSAVRCRHISGGIHHDFCMDHK